MHCYFPTYFLGTAAKFVGNIPIIILEKKFVGQKWLLNDLFLKPYRNRV